MLGASQIAEQGDSALISALMTPVCAAADLRVAMPTPNAEALRLLIGAVPVAAVASPTTSPGRGQAKLPTGAVVPFQAASVTARWLSSATNVNRPTVRIQDWHELGEPLKSRRPARPEGDAGPTDLSLLVGALKKAVE